MRGTFAILLAAILTVACSKEELRDDQRLNYEYGRDIPHGMIELGDRLENPYTTENMTKALHSLYPTKADRIDVKPTNLYVRFLPESEAEFEKLKSMTTDLMDHPMDYDIRVEGDWYHDPSVDNGNITWQYAVVPPDFKFPKIRYEIIDECYISENDPGTRADGIDWEAVEMESYRLTGNGDMIRPQNTKVGKVQPSGRLTIVDEDYCGGKPIGISGVRVSCNSFVKFSHAVTDRDGYYQMGDSFSADPRYRIVFKNEKGFSIGFNLVLVPASVSTLGKNGPEGVDITVTKDMDEDGKLFRRSVVNNAAYDYFTRCSPDDMNIPTPPSDLRIWLFNSLEVSSAVMLHHGAIVGSDLIKSFLEKCALILEYFLPDITIGTKGLKDYKTIYSATCHELAHASHFTKVGTGYWNNYIFYIIDSFLKTHGMTYGEGTGDKAGYCEIGEMWAYYIESKMFKERYGGSFPTFGSGYWFYPEIFRYLGERGLDASDIMSVLDDDVKSRNDLRTALTTSFPESRTAISQIFDRY